MITKESLFTGYKNGATSFSFGSSSLLDTSITLYSGWSKKNLMSTTSLIPFVSIIHDPLK
jgi:hypothetical protein